MVELLIEAKCNLDALTTEHDLGKGGETALMAGASRLSDEGMLDSLKLLVEAKV